MTALRLTLAREWPDAYGERVAHAPPAAGDLWACASSAELRVYADGTLVQTAGVAGEVLGELTFSVDGARVLVAPLAFDRATGGWAARPAVAAALGYGLPTDAAAGFGARAGAWAADGSALALYGEFRPRRGVPAAGAGYEGPSARLVLLEGDRPSVVWEGSRTEPRAAVLVSGALVASGGRAIDVRDRASGRPLAVLGAFSAVARTLRLDPSEAHLAAGAADGTVAIWSTVAWEESARWAAHAGEARGLAWHPIGTTLATGGDDGLVRLWTPTGDLLGELDLGAPVTGLAFRPDGTGLLAARSGPGACVAAVDV